MSMPATALTQKMSGGLIRAAESAGSWAIREPTTTRAASGLGSGWRCKWGISFPYKPMMIMDPTRTLKYCLLVVAGLYLSCKEPLPAYRDPTDLFSGLLRIGYLYGTPPANVFIVQMVVFNDFDETFEGRTLFEGTIEIVLARKPDVKKTFFLSVDHL